MRGYGAYPVGIDNATGWPAAPMMHINGATSTAPAAGGVQNY